jgi:2-formylbenzoate dehydrogenase
MGTAGRESYSHGREVAAVNSATRLDAEELLMPQREEILERPWRLVIDGSVVAPLAGRYTETTDPATELVAARVPDADGADVDRAVRAAGDAWPAWRRLAPGKRAQLVRELGRAVLERRDEFAFLDALDGGFPISSMRNDIRWAFELTELFANSAMALGGDTMPASAEHLHYTTREPFGVVGRIVPFNHPVFFAVGKVAAPLVAGNTVVLKPAEQTPLSALRFGELAAEILPPGVLNVVTGLGPAAGRALVAHPDVRRLAFIGSDAVGRAIQREAADYGVKNVTLELGGKNAMLVLPGADVERAAEGAVYGMNFVGAAGQSCGSNSRVLVHRDLERDLVDRVAARVDELRIGPPLSDHSEVGTLISESQRRRAEGYVEIGLEEGAQLVCGGRRPPGFDRGYYYEPTVFRGVDPRSRLGQEEVFGPVLSIVTFTTEEEAIAIANGVDYGLTASVWTEDVRSAHRVTRELDVGYVWINGSSRHFWGMPFGGTKSSGVGREESVDELLSFTQVKSVSVFLD